MLKALFRKQFSELISQFSRNRRQKSLNKSSGVILFLVVYLIVYISIGATFFTASKAILEMLTPETLPIYYLIIGLIASAIGLLGSVFNAYSSIYEAKDTEMLLSLPIPPSRIVFVRVFSLMAMTLLYEGAILLPALIVFLLYAPITPIGAISSILLFLPMTLIVVSLSLGLAFVIAAVARRVKNKKAATMILSIVLIVLFYYLYFRAQNLVTMMTQDGTIPAGVRYGLFFYYAMGTASAGSIGGLGIVFGTAIAVFLLAYFLLSKYFLKFTTAKKTATVKSKNEKLHAGSHRRALFRREWQLYSSSPNYILNSSFGVIFLTAVTIFAIVKADMLHTAIAFLQEALPNSSGCAIAAILVMFMGGMNDITAPSISMEGRRIYLLRALPVNPMSIFFAKLSLHLVVVLPATLFASVTFSVIFGADLFGAIMIPIASSAYILFVACFGLVMNLIRPVLDWKDEMAAVKTGVSVLASVFGTILIALVLMGLYFACALLMPDGVYLLIVTLLLLGASGGMLYWLSTVGQKKFEALS